MNKRSTIVEVGKRTRMRNHDVQRMVEALIEVWSEALIRGEKIEIENFLILELHTITRHGRPGVLLNGSKEMIFSTTRREVRVRLSKHLKTAIRSGCILSK